MFRRAAINAALGSARSFYSNLSKWRKRKEKADGQRKEIPRSVRQFPLVPGISRPPSTQVVEGAQRLIHHDQSLDRERVELGEGSYHGPRNP